MPKRTAFIWANIGLLFIAWLIAFSTYANLPNQMPTHFNIEGQPDSWGMKTPFPFFLLPIIQTISVLLIMILMRYPQLYNFPQKREVSNWPKKFRRPVYDFINFFGLLVAFMVNITFLIIQRMIIDSARTALAGKSSFWLILAVSIAWLPLLIYFLIGISRVISKQKLEIFRRDHMDFE